jgi:hypothetical protein
MLTFVTGNARGKEMNQLITKHSFVLTLDLTPEIHPQEITEMCTNDDPLE